MEMKEREHGGGNSNARNVTLLLLYVKLGILQNDTTLPHTKFWFCLPF